MKLEQLLAQRSGGNCELCGATGNTTLYEVPPQDQREPENCIMACPRCIAQIEKKEELDKGHWNCLTTSMWSEALAVQVVSWRMLNRLRDESWAADALDMMYLDETALAWARDCNGQVLHAGDSVVLIKSLDVKGSTLNAKMGTVVRNIRLVPDNTGQIEGRIEGQVIVILTRYVRKQGA
jgi:protein PhnA